MSGEVTKLYHMKSLPSADALLTQEIGEFKDVMLMGYDEEGRLRYCVTKGITIAEIFLLMDAVKHEILSGNIHDRTQVK